jgi:hypothetical protein
LTLQDSAGSGLSDVSQRTNWRLGNEILAYGFFEWIPQCHHDRSGGGASLVTAAYTVALARLSYNLGPQFHSLFELWKRPRSEWPEFICSNELNETHRRFSRPKDQQLTNDKLAFSAHCIGHGLPTIPILCTIDLRPDAVSLGIPNGRNVDTWVSALEAAPERIFIKPIDGKLGDGAFSAVRDGDYWHFEDRAGTTIDLHTFCIRNILGKRGWLIQPAIRPHSVLSAHLSPQALCTVRAVTCMASGKPQLLYTVLRIPVGNSQTDNWSLGLSGNLVAPIEPSTGVLGLAYGSRSTSWPVIYSTDRHPDTEQIIVGYTVPHWELVKDLVLRAQATLPQIPTLGWDIAITDTGPLIVETNWGWGVELIEVALQKGLRSELSPTFAHQRVQ